MLSFVCTSIQLFSTHTHDALGHMHGFLDGAQIKLTKLTTRQLGKGWVAVASSEVFEASCKTPPPRLTELLILVRTGQI